MVEWPIKHWNGLQLHHQCRRNSMKVQSFILKSKVEAINQQPIHGTICPIAKVHVSAGHGVSERGNSPLYLIATHRITAPCPENFWAFLTEEIFVSKGGIPPSRWQIQILLNWKLKLPPCHFVLLLHWIKK